MTNRRLSDSINNALDGLIYAFRTEKNLKIHALISILVLTLSLFLDLTPIELLFVLSAICLVIFAELVNTSAETLVNLLTLEHHPLARIVKDVAAGAVLVTCAYAGAVGYLILVPAMRRPLFLGIIERLHAHAGHEVVIMVVLVLVTLVLARALLGPASLSRGGLISGHAALAFGISTAILLISHNLMSTVLAFGLAILVAHSRVEGNFQRWVEVATGALLGIVASLLVFEILASLKGPA
ncbi:MAG TPA: diacylglycerol kinase [Candidatus Xenobia bacterium]|jgi:diacylglycerol kinase (ATP)